MQKTQKLSLAILIQAALISSAYANEQSEAKGFIEDAEGSVLFRTGYINRDKKTVGVKDQSSAAQSAIFKLDSGYTQGVVGFGVGVVGDASFKLGANKNASNNMIPRET
ncbi:MAG: OprD family outer membrane porin, partial [Acinetobacter sp.]